MDQYRDTVGFAMSTWRKVKAFQEGLRNLEQRLPMRSAGIRQEMPYAAAQARAAGLTLSEPVLQGYDLMAMPPLGLLKKVPSLGIYRHFVWLGEAEGASPPPDRLCNQIFILLLPFFPSFLL